MTHTQAIRAERRRAERERIARANQAAAQTVLMLLAVILIFALASLVMDGTTDANLMQAEYDQWAARGVQLWEW